MSRRSRILQRLADRAVEPISSSLVEALDDAFKNSRKSLRSTEELAKTSEQELLRHVRSLDARLATDILSLEQELTRRVTRMEENVLNEPPRVRESSFYDIARPVVEAGRTLLGYDRLYVLWQAVRNAGHLPGAIAEIGSYRGGSAHFLAAAHAQLFNGDVRLDVYDTFEGHPQDKLADADAAAHQAGRFADTSVDRVREYLALFEHVHVHQGEFSAQVGDADDRRYSLVHADTDLYQPTLDILRHYEPRLPIGGIVVVDDYGSEKCPGVRKAIREFLEESAAVFQVWDVETEQLLLVKAAQTPA